MNQSDLLRDYGITLALLLASVLLFWTTMVPQIEENRKLDEAYFEQMQRRVQAEQELQRLQLLENMNGDSVVVESLARDMFGPLGLPPGEHMLPVVPGEE